MLAMVLVLIAVAAISVVHLAGRSFELAGEAVTAQEDLQRRWGLISCQRAMLAQANEIIDAQSRRVASDNTGWPLAGKVAVDFMLGRLHFVAVLADEDAKVDLNAIYRSGTDGVNRVRSVVVQTAGSDDLVTRIYTPTKTEATYKHSPFESWGQIFELASSDSDVKVAGQLREATQEITCWGSGRLNVQRASDAAVQMVCEANGVSQSAARKLLALRREPGEHEFDEIIGGLALKIRERVILQRVLTDQSNCHSLWIVVANERRQWATLVIDHPGQGSANGRQTFSW